MNIAMKKKGIVATEMHKLRKKDWIVLTEAAGGDENFARQCVYGYFDGTATDNISE